MKDAAGQEVVSGDTIVYFTRSGSCMYSHIAKVEWICALPTYKSVRVVKLNTERQNLPHRKVWLHDLSKAVKVNINEAVNSGQ